MASSSFLFLLAVFLRDIIIWCPDDVRFVTVSAIGFHHFARKKFLFKLRAKDFDVRETSTREWTIGPHNIATANRNSQLVPKPRPTELVGIPHGGEWSGFFDFEIGPIHGNYGPVIILGVIRTAVPLNLQGNL